MPKTFTSPAPYFAQVKEELKSYFATGAIDDLLFPIWLEDALASYRKSAYPIYETLIEINNFMGELPCGFKGVKAVWSCHNIISNPIWNPSSYYEQVDCRITPFDDKCHECFDNQECTTLNPDYAVTIKHTGKTWFTYSFNQLLRPATAHTLNHCGEDCENIHSDCSDTFDIRDGKISVPFRDGKVHIIYYSSNLDENEEQLVPDDRFTKNYIVAYIRYKCFESLYNTISDESVNIIERKLQRAEAEMYSQKVIAETEMKKETSQQIINRANRTKLRFNNYRRRLR